MSTPSPLAAEIAVKIRAEVLPVAQDGRLPSIRRLSLLYRVSRLVMAEALRSLENEGLIRIYPRRNPIVVSASPLGAKIPEQPVDSLDQWLRDAVESGHFPSGAVLPKVHWLAARFGISHHSVRKVLRRHEAIRLAHQHGRHWMAGPKRSGIIGAIQPKVILVISSSIAYWKHLFKSVRTEQFVRAFVSEAEQCGIRIRLATLDTKLDKQLWYPKGKASIEKAFNEIKDRCRGVLLAVDEGNIANTIKWLANFLPANIPLAWFDRNDSGWPSEGRVGSRWLRCHPCEQAVAACAADFLAERGHRRAAYVRIHKDSNWQERRGTLMAEYCRSARNGLEIVDRLSIEEKELRYPAATGFLDLLSRMRDTVPPPVTASFAYVTRHADVLARKYRTLQVKERVGKPWNGFLCASAAALLDGEILAPADLKAAGLIWSALSMRACLFDRTITALIAPNDDMAVRFHTYWLAESGFSVPETMSFLSFDNAFRDLACPLTTIDFGFAGLGYRAFHALLEDIPIRKKSDGSIAAKPLGIDRGTVRVLE